MKSPLNPNAVRITSSRRGPGEAVLSPVPPADNGAELLAWRGVKAFFVLTVVAVALLTGARSRASSPASRHTVLPALVHPGRVEEVQAGTPGRIVAVRVRAGQMVQMGEVLAEIENPELQADVRLARQRLDLVRRRAAAEGKNGSVSSARLKSAEAQLAAAVSARNSARSRVEAAAAQTDESALARARGTAANIRGLVDRRLATAAELVAAELTVENERQMLAARRDSRSRLVQEREAAENQIEIARLQIATLRVAPGAGQELDIKEAASLLEKLERRLSALVVVAPVAGLVTLAPAPGTAVGEGTVLFRVGELDRLIFEVAVSPSLAREVRQGDPVTVRVPLDPPVEVEARVDEVEWAPRSGQAYTVRVGIPNPDPAALVAGLEGSVAFGH